MAQHSSAATVHVALTAPEAAGLAALARDRRTSQRQVMRDALALLLAQQPTAATAAATLDAGLQRLLERLDARLDAALDGAVTHLVAQWRQDLTRLAQMLPRATPATTTPPAAAGPLFAPPIDPVPGSRHDGR